MSAKQAINDKFQGSVATYWTYGGVVNKHIKKGLLLSLWVKIILKSVYIWQSYKQERDCVVHFAHLANTLLNTKIFNVHFTANIPRDLPVKKIL